MAENHVVDGFRHRQRVLKVLKKSFAPCGSTRFRCVAISAGITTMMDHIRSVACASSIHPVASISSNSSSARSCS